VTRAAEVSISYTGETSDRAGIYTIGLRLRRGGADSRVRPSSLAIIRTGQDYLPRGGGHHW